MIDFDKGVAFSASVLDAAALRTRVILHNIANQNTPGFKRYAVTFEDELRSVQQQDGDVSKVHPRVVRDRSGPRGENNVSVMQEMAALEKVKLIHDFFARRTGGYFSHLNKAIAGRI